MTVCNFSANGSLWSIDTNDVVAVQQQKIRNTKNPLDREITIHLISGTTISFDLKNHEKMLEAILKGHSEKYQQIKSQEPIATENE